MVLVFNRGLQISTKTSQKVEEQPVLGKRPWKTVSTYQILKQTSVRRVGSLLQGDKLPDSA